MSEEDGSRLARWSRRKAQVRSGIPALEPVPLEPAPVVVLPVAADATAAAATAPTPLPPPPTLEDVARLDRDSDFSRFVMPGVDDGVKRAAMKKLFSDPHFNVMDGLDTYIDDYGKPDPIPEAMLRRMTQSQFLRLFEEEPASAQASPDGAAAPALPQSPTEPQEGASRTDEDTDLRLQPDDAADPAGAGPDRPGPRP